MNSSYIFFVIICDIYICICKRLIYFDLRIIIVKRALKLMVPFAKTTCNFLPKFLFQFTSLRANEGIWS